MRVESRVQTVTLLVSLIYFCSEHKGNVAKVKDDVSCIFVICSWVDTRWQQYSVQCTHKQCTERHNGNRMYRTERKNVSLSHYIAGKSQRVPGS